MFPSLRLRLLAGFLLVALVAVGVVATFASQVTGGQFRGYVEQRGVLGRSRYESLLGRLYAEQGSWEGAQTLVERMGEVSGDQLVLVDPTGKVIADSAGKLVGRHTDPGWDGGPIPVMAPASGHGGPLRNLPGPGRGLAPPEAAGAIFVNPLAGQDAEALFLDAVNRWLFVAAGAAGVLALLLTLGISRRILGPIESLTAVARRMEHGDLRSRVEVRSNDEIGELAHAFNAMAEALAHNETLRRHMVSDVAHELRTPLTNIRGYLEGLRDGVFHADKETIESLHQEAELLGRIVNDLQDLALAEAGQLRLKLEPVAMKEVIEGAVHGARPLATKKGLRLDTALSESLPIVEADAERLGQVLRNLLNNAVSHTPPGGSVTVSGRQNDHSVQISVADTGAGIAPEHLPYVFERFYRADPSRTRATGGAGLGLAIARQIVEAHGGRIWVDTRERAGATFSFSLPATRAQSPAGRANATVS